MPITINGQSVDIENGISLLQCLEQQGFLSTDTNNRNSKAHLAVELNTHIILSEQYATTLMADGDVLEVLHFVGGG